MRYALPLHQLPCLAMVLFVVAGCGIEADQTSGSRHPGSSSNAAPPQAAKGEGGAAQFDIEAADVERKIIYTASLRLVVEDFAAFEAALPKLVSKHRGYLGDVSVDSSRGEARRGTWVARVPVGQYSSFLDDVANLGVPQQRDQSAQDVTEEYIDIEARIASKQKLEERILQLLESPEGKIKDIIEVERELARVRSEIEQMQGRLRYLANRTSLTTVTISAREQKNYVPPQAPTFTSRVVLAWQNSLAAMQEFGTNLAIMLVAAFPWFAVIGVIAIPPAWLLRRRSKRNRRDAGTRSRQMGE